MPGGSGCPTPTPTYTPTPSGSGLLGMYYNDTSFGVLGLARQDAAVNFDWNSGSPDAMVNADNISVRWTGKIQPEYSETFTFTVEEDQGAKLWVNGQLIVDKWDSSGTWTGQIALTAGNQYDIKLEYKELTGTAKVKLYWQSASQVYEIVPSGHLFPDPVPTEMPGGSGTGLTGAYYYYNNLTALMYTKVDPTVNFNWGTGSPTSLPADNFSIRWTGKVQAKYTETYTFYLQADDGVRLWVNNQLIIDSWSYAPERSATMALTAGQKYDIKLEYRELTGNASVKLLWASHTQAKQIIPQSQLTPDSPTPTPSFTATQTFTATITDTAVPPTNTPTATQIAHSGQIWKTYYYAGAQRVAMRVQGDPNPSANGVFYTLGDHLGSTSLVTDASGSKISEMRYKPWGETRFSSGQDVTSYHYTGQREESGIGLYYYNARWYDPEIAHFIQSDTIISSPARPSSWDNYAYVNNNSLKNIDPSGHCTGTYNDSDPCWAKYRELSTKNPKLVLRDMNRIDEDRLTGLLQWSERGVILEGNFGYWEAVITLNGLNLAQKYFGDKTDAALRLDHGSLTIRWGLDDAKLNSMGAGGTPDVLTNKVLMLTGQNRITNFLHELCHIIDYNMGGTNYWSVGNYLTEQYIHYYFYWEGVKGFNYWIFLDYSDSDPGFSTKNPIEDFADSLMMMILKDQIGIPDKYEIPDKRRRDDIEKGKNSL